MTTPAHTGEKLRLLRSKALMTQVQLAEKAGVHRRTVQDIERGDVQPRLTTWVRLATALAVPLGELTGSTEHEGDTAA